MSNTGTITASASSVFDMSNFMSYLELLQFETNRPGVKPGFGEEKYIRLYLAPETTEIADTFPLLESLALAINTGKLTFDDALKASRRLYGYSVNTGSLLRKTSTKTGH